jgi:hypothetical protein
MVEEGECVSLYARYAINCMAVGLILYGILQCDEMKLIEGVVWNTKSHAVHGFAGDCNSLDKLVRGALTGNADKMPAVEVNQWKYRALNGNRQSFECEFFYNDGTLTNADIRRQFLQVTCNLELINCQVLGWDADGASKNVTAMRALSVLPTQRIPHSLEWLDITYLSCVHPIDQWRRLFFWLCSTHQLKNVRGQLWTSRIAGKRGFVSADGCIFGWDWLMLQHDRDKVRPSPETSLRDLAMYLDGWAKMNVSLAKAPFQINTLSEGLNHIPTNEDEILHGVA